MKKLLLITATVFFIQTSNAQTGTVTDIDGNIYNTVTIGTQKWMKENLKTTHYQNGDSIGTTWPANYYYMNESKPKYQWAYNGKDSLANIYGRLYTWYAATDNRNVCPTGWHLPTKNEFVTLDNYLGGASVAKGKLKETGTVHWNSPNTDATDAVGFTGLPGGSHWPTGEFVDMGIAGHYWAANLEAPGWAYRMLLTNNIMDAQYHINSAEPTIGWTVRCLEDPIPDSVKYFGQTPPGNKAVKFAPGIVSLPKRGEYILTFSTDYDECYFSTYSSDYVEKNYRAKRINNSWTSFTETPYFASFFSADGKKIIYEKSGDIFLASDTTGGWGVPITLPSAINSTSYDDSYSETTKGVKYICSDRPGGLGKQYEIWRINPLTNKAENLGPIINSTPRNITPCIAPDESYLIYTQSNGNYEHLYISFNKGNNEWTNPLNMDKSGAGINTLFQTCPKLSPDGKYLFFNKHNPDYADSSDIYWVSTSIIDTLKKIAMPTTLINQAIDKKAMLYPNPTNGHITLSLGTSQNRETLVVVYNLQGTQVFSKTYQNTTSETIDLTDNSAGIYLVKVIADGVSNEEKIIKE